MDMLLESFALQSTTDANNYRELILEEREAGKLLENAQREEVLKFKAAQQDAQDPANKKLQIVNFEKSDSSITKIAAPLKITAKKKRKTKDTSESSSKQKKVIREAGVTNKITENLTEKPSAVSILAGLGGYGSESDNE